jgi:NTE family protein
MPAQQPRVGLVLAGGGAKGAAHVGVLKVLEEMHVPVDCIAGTSMGALVGGGYASGIPAPQMEVFLRGINWRRVIGGLGRRSLEPIEQKRQGDIYSNNLRLGIQHSRIVLAPGLIDSSAIEDLLRGFVAKARSQTDFDQLPIPYRAVATDMVTGQMLVLDHGDLATAMRASMSIPGAFAPVTTEGHILSDGGLVRNIPVDVARKLCADVVIVVNPVEPPVQPERLQSTTQLLARTVDLMIEANERQQLQSLTAQDVRIDVEMGDIGTADFERTPEAIALGEAAARRAAPELERYAVSSEQYLAWRTKVIGAGHRDPGRTGSVRGIAESQSGVSQPTRRHPSRRQGRRRADQPGRGAHVRAGRYRVGRLRTDGRSGECDARMATPREELGARLPQSGSGPVRHYVW